MFRPKKNFFFLIGLLCFFNNGFSMECGDEEKPLHELSASDYSELPPEMIEHIRSFLPLKDSAGCYLRLLFSNHKSINNHARITVWEFYKKLVEVNDIPTIVAAIDRKLNALDSSYPHYNNWFKALSSLKLRADQLTHQFNKMYPLLKNELGHNNFLSYKAHLDNFINSSLQKISNLGENSNLLDGSRVIEKGIVLKELYLICQKLKCELLKDSLVAVLRDEDIGTLVIKCCLMPIAYFSVIFIFSIFGMKEYLTDDFYYKFSITIAPAIFSFLASVLGIITLSYMISKYFASDAHKCMNLLKNTLDDINEKIGGLYRCDYTIEEVSLFYDELSPYSALWKNG